MALLYGRAGRLRAQNGGVRPGRAGTGVAEFETEKDMNDAIDRLDDKKVRAHESHRVGPNAARRPKILGANPY
jgi:hypothetical protein